MNDQVLREIDQDLRNERLQQFWRKYRGLILAAVVLLVAITAGSSIWEDYQSKKAGEAMVKLDAAIQQLQKGEAAQAAGNFAKLAKESKGELHDMSLLWQARAEALANEADAAVRTLSTLASKPAGKDLVWRDIACLRLMAANADTPKACTTTGNSPLKSQRLEWHAALLWQEGKQDEARVLLRTIVDDETAPASQRERAKRLMRALPAKAA